MIEINGARSELRNIKNLKLVVIKEQTLEINKFNIY